MKTYKYISLIILTSLLGIVSCNANNGKSPKVVPPPEEENEKTDVVYLGLFDSKEYNPNSKLTFTSITVSDTQIANYVDGMFITTNIEGTTTARFVSSTLCYTVTVNVAKDDTIPLFEIETQSISVFAGAEFTINTSLTYRGVDVNSYASEMKITKETNNNSSSISVVGETIHITGLNVGTDSYTISRQFAGFTVSKYLEVSAKENNDLIVLGHELSYSVEGPFYNISLYGYNDHRILLTDDIAVLKNGNPISYNDIVITPNDTNILDIQDNYLVPKKTGNTSFDISYLGETVTVAVYIYKPLLGSERFSLENMDFNLDMDVSVDTVKKSRTYTQGNTTKQIKIPGDDAFENVATIKVDGTELNLISSNIQYDKTTRYLTMSASLFNIMNFGKKLVTVTMEAPEYLYEYRFNVNFITKTLSSRADINKYLTQKYDVDVIYGQYILESDIDFEGAYATAGYINLSSLNYDYYSYGFRGILEGNGYSIKNYKTTLYGLFLIIGNDAIIRNINFDEVHYMSIPSGSSLGTLSIGRFVSGATLSNITLTLASDSASDDASVGSDFGVVATQVFSYCTVVDFTINAQGFDLIRVFGNNINGTVFKNTNIYCRSITTIGGRYSEVDGVTIHLD